MPIRLQPPAHVPDLPTAIAHLRAAPAEPATLRDAIYRDEVFPFAAARLLAARDQQPSAELLVIPVGTQPYSPLLAALATPARCVALLVTTKSTPCADEVAAALAQLPAGQAPAVERFAIGDANSGLAVVRAVDAALFWAGDPWPADVTLDVTGGRKATSAALGALAGLRGFRQVYIEGQELERGRFHNEQLLVLDDVRSALQEDDRAAAVALFEAGAFSAAEARLELLAERLLIGPALGWLRDFARAAQGGADAPTLWSQLAIAVPPGAIRDAVSQAAQCQSPGAAEASAILGALHTEGAWR